MNEYFAKKIIKNLLKKRKKSVLGTNRVKQVINLLELEKEFKIIHIAGTNGKGSVATYIYNGLKACGLKVGLFISPISTTFLNCFSSSNRDINYIDFLKAYRQLKARLKHKINKDFFLTSFELEFLLGLIIFKNQGLEYIIIEAGMGGRDDATNVFTHKICNIFTSISEDHIPLLGKNIYEILENKVDIINKADNINIFYPLETNLEDHLKRYLLRKNITRFLIIKQQDNYDVIFNNKKYSPIMLGEYQKVNFYLACNAILELIKNKFLSIDYDSFLFAASQAVLPLRLEKIGQKIIIDACHNEDACLKLLAFWQANYNLNDKVLIVFGAYKDKDVEKMLKVLKQISSNFLPVIISDDPRRSLSKKELRSSLTKLSINFTNPISDKKASQKIKREISNWDKILICGSLAMAKNIRQKLIKSKAIY